MNCFRPIGWAISLTPCLENPPINLAASTLTLDEVHTFPSRRPTAPPQLAPHIHRPIPLHLQPHHPHPTFARHKLKRRRLLRRRIDKRHRPRRPHRKPRPPTASRLPASLVILRGRHRQDMHSHGRHAALRRSTHVRQVHP